MSIIKLQSKDGEVFEADVGVIKVIRTLKDIIEDMKMEDEDCVIPLDQVDSKTLKKVLDWATHHKDDPPPLDDPLVFFTWDDIVLDEWDKEFFNVDLSLLFHLLAASHDLSMKGMRDQAFHVATSLFGGKSAEEITAVLEERGVKLENNGETGSNMTK